MQILEMVMVKSCIEAWLDVTPAEKGMNGIPCDSAEVMEALEY
jgi:hypothetical protein